MTTQQISQHVRDLITQGDLDEAANALVQFFDKEWMSRADKEQVQLYNQALYQLSQLNELKHQVFAGIISNEDADLKRNKIRAALLEISKGLENFDPTRPSSRAPALPAEDGLRHKRRIALILILGIPLSIMIVMLIIGLRMCKPIVDTIRSVEETSQQQPAVRQQPVAPTTEKTFTGCYIETGMMTQLLQRPEIGGAMILELPKHKKYQVLDTKKRNLAGQTVYFFKIQEGEYTGWVRQIQLAFTSPACLQ